MRFDAIPDFEHGELGRIRLGLIQRDGFAALRGFDAGQDGEQKVTKGVC